MPWGLWRVSPGHGPSSREASWLERSEGFEDADQLRDDAAINFLVRMGLHTGEAIERDRSYFGSEVNRAARLMSLAHGGQMLVSDTTEVLLRNRVALRPLGEHRLRGLRGRMSVYQVVADGLPTEFPVLRSVDYFTGNLPEQLSSLVGLRLPATLLFDYPTAGELVAMLYAAIIVDFGVRATWARGTRWSPPVFFQAYNRLIREACHLIPVFGSLVILWMHGWV